MLIPTDKTKIKDEHFSIIEDIVCKNSKFFYEEAEIKDLIGIDIFEIKSKF